MGEDGGVRTSRRLMRILFTIAGTVCLGLGALGIILPLLPTTPFLLLAAAFYLRGSERMYRWLLTNKLFGSYIRNYREGKGIPLRAKISALVLLWVTITFSAMFILRNSILRLILFTIAAGVSLYLLKLPTLKKT